MYELEVVNPVSPHGLSLCVAFESQAGLMWNKAHGDDA